MDSSTKLSQILYPEKIKKPYLHRDEMSPGEWAEIIWHIANFSKRYLKYLPGMKPLNEHLQSAADDNHWPIGEEVIESSDFNRTIRCVRISHKGTNIDDPRPIYNPGHREQDKLLVRSDVMLADNGDFFVWHSKWERIGRAQGRVLSCLVCRFTPVVDVEQLALGIDLMNVRYNFLRLFKESLAFAISEREKHVQNFKNLWKEVDRIEDHISVVPLPRG